MWTVILLALTGLAPGFGHDHRPMAYMQMRMVTCQVLDLRTASDLKPGEFCRRDGGLRIRDKAGRLIFYQGPYALVGGELQTP